MTSLIPPNGRTHKDYALMYAGMGFKVFPVWPIVPGFEEGDPGVCACAKGPECDRPGKHPLSDLVPSGVSDATGERARIENWWGHRPDASIGIATGRQSNLTVIDVDVSDGKPGLLNLTRLCGDRGGVPQTLTVETGSGGLHLYFRYNVALRTGANVIDEAIDVRNDSGYVVAPPSLHACGGFYKWR